MQKKTLKKPIVLTIGKKKHTIKKIEFASDKIIRDHGEFAYEFLQKIFGVKGALLSDMSSVYDFDFTFDFEKDTVHHDTAKFLKKIKRIYKVDVSDIKGLLIYKILDRIVEVDHACKYTRENLNRLVCEWERTKKQRECDHAWDQVSYIQAGLQTIRIFCTKCKFHIERKERRVIKWEPWSRLPNIGPKYKQYVDSQRPRIRPRKNSVTRVTDK